MTLWWQRKEPRCPVCRKPMWKVEAWKPFYRAVPYPGTHLELQKIQAWFCRECNEAGKA